MKTKTKLVLLRIAGFATIPFTLFHIAFYWLFNWSVALQPLAPMNRAIFLTFNLVGILFLVYSAIMSLGYSRNLIEEKIGKSLLLFFSAFYVLRIIAEFAWFGIRMPASISIIAICLLPALCFALPALTKSK